MRVNLNCLRMTTCEPTRSSAYSSGLRWRMVWQTLALNIPVSCVARNLCVHKRTVHRIVTSFKTTGSVDKRQYPKERLFRKITTAAEFYTLSLVIDQPGICLREIKLDLLLNLGLDVTESAICVFLQKAGFTRQHLKLYARQQDKHLRTQFIADMSLYTAEMMVFLDEAGTDRRDSIRAKGYSLRGKPGQKQTPLARGEHVSAICIMSVDGILTCELVSRSVNGDKFIEFIENSLLPNLMPFNGQYPNSVIVMDNCSIHYVNQVTDLIRQTVALIHWLPPYSPDMNPIEEAFSKAKSVMRAMEIKMQVTKDTDLIIYSAFSCITPCHCQGWIADTGIYHG